MAVNRQNSLFAAEDWKVAYRAYSQIDFQAYDFDTMRTVMVDYVRTNFPENFNDYIESSEFIAIIELLAYLSQSLAFRMDVNTRENFLETAERRDSVFKLARMLGYNPKRNIPASGLMKLVSVKTTEPLVDSLGNQLSNITVFWDDANNSQSYEQFITIMNSAMSKTNRFSAPIKQGTVGGVSTELYQLNTPAGSPIAYRFDITSAGTTRNFDVVNPDFEDNSHFFERHPDPTNLFNMIYRNDGKGLNSSNTGFFVMFRQGNIAFTDFNYTIPVQNRLQEITTANVAENDVYLQEINSNGLVLNKWQRVPNTVGQTLNYNSKSLATRNLYSIENTGTAGINLRFTDGNFGNIPVGIYRFWHRVSDPVSYSIQPEDARNISISVPYVNADSRAHSLTITFRLENTVSNSLPAEDIQAIKQRAPQVYYTQNRMVSAQDYNVFPESKSTNIEKIKATNKTHAGHSRYIDINDPTGTYQNVDTFADDGYLYVEDQVTTRVAVINNNTTSTEVVTSIIPDMLKDQAINNFVYYGMRDLLTNPNLGGNIQNFRYPQQFDIRWNALPLEQTSKTGYITEKTGSTTNVLVNTDSKFTQLTANTFVKWVNPVDPTEYVWVRIVDVRNNGQLDSGLTTGTGPWTMSEQVPAGWLLTETIVSLRKLFNQTEALTVINLVSTRKTFALGYDLIDNVWYVIPGEQLTSSAKTGRFALDSNGRGASSWLLLMEYSPIDQFSYRYNITARGQNYVIHSDADLKFYNVNNVKVVDRNNRSSQDKIIFSTVNTKPSISETYEWTGSEWTHTELQTEHVPVGSRVDLPLLTRDTTFRDLNVSWVSNFGILIPAGTSPAEIAAENKYVSDAMIPLTTTAPNEFSTNRFNVIVPANTGQIRSLPDVITVPFGATTFGTNIVKYDSVTDVYYVTYKQIPESGTNDSDELVFVAALGATPLSWGRNGDIPPAEPYTAGRLWFTQYNASTGTGTLEYRDVFNNDLHSSKDRSGTVSRDKLQVRYRNNKQKLDQPIEWQIVGVYQEADGYVDARKVKVAPIDINDDLVPARPRQFSEYVQYDDFVLFEFYTDFDGYTYDRVVKGVIHDFRYEDQLVINNAADTVSPSSYSDIRQLSNTDWVIVKNETVAQQFAGNSNANGIVIYAVEQNTVLQVLPLSTDNTQVVVLPTDNYFVRNGRGKTQNTADSVITNGTIRWQHVAPNDVRIDPSISNIVEMTVLTKSYMRQVRRWQARPTTEFPLEPTSNELTTEFAELNTYKSASDSLVFRSARFRLLFGTQADAVYQARFRVVKLSDQLSDNELKTQIIATINDYFSVENWEFGETFYFTELSTYIHQRLGSAIGSIIILPKSTSGSFGEMFQVTAEPNELFISTATVNDIELISRINNQSLRADR